MDIMLTETLEDVSVSSGMQTELPVIHIGMATCGLASGARGLLDLIKKEVEKRQLNVRIVPTGCIGMCHNEPLVDVTMPGKYRVSYKNVKPMTLNQIFESHFGKNEFAKKYAICQIPLAGAQPYDAYQSPPFRTIWPILPRVSTLLITLGLPHTPFCAGNGGFGQGIPRSPIMEARRAVSSPHT